MLYFCILNFYLEKFFEKCPGREQFGSKLANYLGNVNINIEKCSQKSK
jgi:hypothetical protein